MRLSTYHIHAALQISRTIIRPQFLTKRLAKYTKALNDADA